MRNVIIPAEITQENAINIYDITENDLIIAYSNEEAIGFVIYSDKEWSIQIKSDVDYTTSRWYNTLIALARAESKNYPNFNLKVL